MQSERLIRQHLKYSIARRGISEHQGVHFMIRVVVLVQFFFPILINKFYLNARKPKCANCSWLKYWRLAPPPPLTAGGKGGQPIFGSARMEHVKIITDTVRKKAVMALEYDAVSDHLRGGPAMAAPQP